LALLTEIPKKDNKNLFKYFKSTHATPLDPALPFPRQTISETMKEGGSELCFHQKPLS